jgi:predicted site-specific integrase-resolvase
VGLPLRQGGDKPIFTSEAASTTAVVRIELSKLSKIGGMGACLYRLEHSEGMDMDSETPSNTEHGPAHRVGYVRYASASAADSSLERQITEISNYANGRGASIQKFFKDANASGISVNRQGLNELLEFCDKHFGTEVFITTFDRLGRNNEAFVKFVACSIKSGATLVETRTGRRFSPDDFRTALGSLAKKLGD